MPFGVVKSFWYSINTMAVVFGFIGFAPVVSCFEAFASTSFVPPPSKASPTQVAPAARNNTRRPALAHSMTSEWYSMYLSPVYVWIADLPPLHCALHATTFLLE